MRRRSADFRQYHKRCTGFTQTLHKGAPFFAEPQRGDSPSADGGNVAAPAAGAKRKDNLRFSFLFELLPFPYSLVWRRLPTCDRFEKENGRGFLLPCLSLPIRSVRYRTATQTGYSTQARHKVNCPKGKRGSPGGYPCRATRWLGYSARQLRIALVVPQGAPTSAHRLYPVCTNYPAGANIVRPRNGKPSRPCANEACAMTAAFSIFHSQFPISGKIKRTLTRPFLFA